MNGFYKMKSVPKIWFIFVFAFSLVGFTYPTEGSEIKSGNLIQPTPTPVRNGKNQKLKSPVDVVELNLDETELNLPCPPGIVARTANCSDKTSISVSTKVEGGKSGKLRYRYTVNGGKIVGSGPVVSWDLTGTPPGTYRITAEADAGCDFCGKGLEKVITVSPCPVCGCGLVDCPTLEINGPDSISNVGDQVFIANVSGGSQEIVTYTWTVVNGEIIDGQGTPTVKVRMPQNSTEKESSITVKLGGVDPDGICRVEASKAYEQGKLKPQ